MLRLTEAPPHAFRGRRVLRRQLWVAVENGRPVGLVSVECYTDRSAELAVAVGPAKRGQGLCRLMVLAALEHGEMQEVDEVRAAIEPENRASVRCFESVGFVRESDEPDDENNLTFVHRRR